MPTFSAGAVWWDSEPLSTEDFVLLTRGLSIVDVEPYESHGVVFTLSGNIRLVVHSERGELFLNVSSINPENLPPLIVRLPQYEVYWAGDSFRTQFNALERLHALVYLVEDERLDLLSNWSYTYARWPYFYPTRKIPREAKLTIESVGRGSWVAAITTRAVRSYRSLIRVLALVFPAARDALLRRIEADTRLREITAQRAALDLRRENFELFRDMVEAGVSLRERIGDPQLQEGFLRLAQAEVARLYGLRADDPIVQEAAQRLLNARNVADPQI